MTRKFLITRADDAGASARVNAAVRRAVAGGLVRNVSVLACGPASAELAEWLPRAGVAIGLHVGLNSEWAEWRWGPVAGREAVPELVEADGAFTEEPRVLEERGVTTEAVMREVRAQIERLWSLGLEPVYLDEHMGVGRVAGLAEALGECAKANGLVVARPGPSLSLRPRQGDVDTDVIGRWAAALAGLGEGRAEARVLITHPGGDVFMPRPEAAWRDAEAAAWADTRWKDALGAAGVEPLSYPEVAGLSSAQRGALDPA